MKFMLPLILLGVATANSATPPADVPPIAAAASDAREPPLGASQAERERAARQLAIQDLISADDQLRLARAALARLDPRSATSERALLLGLECRALYRRDEIDAAQAVCNQSLRLARAANEAAPTAQALRLLAFLKAKGGDPIAAAPLFRQSLEIARAANLDDQQAAALNGLGITALSFGVYHEAADYFDNALDAARRTGDRGLQVMVEVNFGSLQIEIGDNATAIQTLQRAHDDAQRLGNQQIVLLSAAGLAAAYSVAGNVAEADAQLRDHLAAQTDPALDSGIRSRLLTVAAGVALLQKRFDVAARLARQAAQAGSRFPFWRISASLVLAEVQIATGQQDAALALLERLLSEAEHFPALHHDVSVRKAELLAARGDWREAFLVLQHQDANLAGTSRSRALQQAAFMRDLRESDARERELEQLRARNAVIEAHAAGDRQQRNVAVAVSTLGLLIAVLLWIVWSQRNETRARRRLEQAVELRTQELSEQMERRRALEQQLDHKLRLEAVGQLTGGVAHDFNNLMTIVQQSAELLRLNPAIAADAAALGLVAECTQAAQAGGAISRQLLAFARRQPLQPQRVELGRHLEASRGLLERAAGEDRILQIDCSAIAATVDVDPGQLNAALVNLVSNARDATQQGGQITVITGSVTLPDAAFSTDHLPRGRYATLEVRDGGHGMDAATLRRAIEPFFTTKPVGVGTGLGLSMVHGFVTQSGGGLHIESQPGDGTRMVMVLPEVSAS
jgi:signal transduction histidine kinase